MSRVVQGPRAVRLLAAEGLRHTSRTAWAWVAVFPFVIVGVVLGLGQGLAFLAAEPSPLTIGLRAPEVAWRPSVVQELEAVVEGTVETGSSAEGDVVLRLADDFPETARYDLEVRDGAPAWAQATVERALGDWLIATWTEARAGPPIVLRVESDVGTDSTGDALALAPDHGPAPADGHALDATAPDDAVARPEAQPGDVAQAWLFIGLFGLAINALQFPALGGAYASADAATGWTGWLRATGTRDVDLVHASFVEVLAMFTVQAIAWTVVLAVAHQTLGVEDLQVLASGAAVLLVGLPAAALQAHGVGLVLGSWLPRRPLLVPPVVTAAVVGPPLLLAPSVLGVVSQDVLSAVPLYGPLAAWFAVPGDPSVIAWLPLQLGYAAAVAVVSPRMLTLDESLVARAARWWHARRRPARP